MRQYSQPLPEASRNLCSAARACYNARTFGGHLGIPRLRGWFKRRRVSADWRARLPEVQQQVFDLALADLQCSYTMFSVVLNEALHLRAEGSLVGARESAAVTAELLCRLAGRLRGTLCALEEQGRHLSDLPEVLSLDAVNFRGAHARRLADWNGLLHRVLLNYRSRFFHKVSVLDDLVELLAREFCDAATEIAEGASVRPAARWAALESLHYDLNTCQQETIVVLKSFLLFLPPEQVQSFERRLAEAVERETLRQQAPVRIPSFSRTRR